MENVYLAYSILGVTILLLALAAEKIKQLLWMSEPLLATLVGVLVGQYGLEWLDFHHWDNSHLVLEELARLTLAISLIGVAFRLPDTWIRQYGGSLAILLLIGMPLMWLLTGLSAWQMLQLPLLEALLLGALITPTDPVVASSIVTGELAEKHVDADIRHLISAESGANDGLAFLLVMLPILLIEHAFPQAISEWLTAVLLGKVIASIMGGILLGYFTGKIVDWLYRHEHVHHRSLLAVSIALALACLGFAKLLHGDGILAVFAAGLAFNWLIRKEQGHREAQHERIQETTKQFLDVPVFVFFGMVLPFERWWEMGWPVLVFAMSILLLRRLPVLLLYPFVKPLKNRYDALFVGWFGPIAVAAMVYIGWAEVKQGYEHLWVIGSLVIFVSILVHGITATPLTRLYANSQRKSAQK